MKFFKSTILFILLLTLSHLTYADYQYIRFLKDVSISDIMSVGGKNASLGQMINGLSSQGIRVPHGFAVTVDGYNHYMNKNNVTERINTLLAEITDHNDLKKLKIISTAIRELIENGSVPHNLADEICTAYKELSRSYGEDSCDVAVRSSATAEDLPNASFAGQQDTYLHVQGQEQVLTYYKKCIASLFTDRAIAYRKEQGF